MSRILLLVILLTISFELRSQQYHVVANYTSENTALPNTVYDVTKLRNDNMLLSTNVGLFVYDGNEFFSFSYLNKKKFNESLFGFFEDTKKRIWLFTFKGKLAFIKNHNLYTPENDSTLCSNDLFSALKK
jgi:hypothetical protein